MKAEFTVIVEGEWLNNGKSITATQMEKDLREAAKDRFEFLASKVTVKRTPPAQSSGQGLEVAELTDEEIEEMTVDFCKFGSDSVSDPIGFARVVIARALASQPPAPQASQDARAALRQMRAAFEAWATRDGTYDLRPAKVKMLSVGGVPYDGYARPYLQDRTVHAYEGFVAALAILAAKGGAK